MTRQALRTFVLLSGSAVAPIVAQGRLAPRVDAVSCPSADTVLGPRAQEPGRAVTGWYSRSKDSTRLAVSAAAPAPARLLYSSMVYQGRGSHQPRGLPLGFVFAGSTAVRIANDTATYEVSAFLEPDSMRLTLGPPVHTALDRGSSTPAITVNVILTKAAYLAFVRSQRATVSWGTFTIALGPSELGALRALYRAALCAPAGVGVED